MIQVINRAFDIIEYIAEHQEHKYMLSDIADHLGLNHATCANIIKTLVARGYLDQAGKKRGYQLGPKIFSFTGCFAHHQYMVNAARVPMKKLTRDLNEGSILSIIRDDTRILLHEEKSRNELQVNIYPEKQIYSTSTGRMILAFYDDKELETFVRRYGLPKPEVWPEVDDFEDLKLELGRIRKKDICIQVSRNHIVGVAVPINEEGKIIASLGIYLPDLRFSGERKQMVLDKLVAAGQEINQHIKEYENEAILNKSRSQ